MSGCEKCHGTGKVTCSKCGGKKEVKCERCNGKKGVLHKCSKCNGTGDIDCPRCDGKGNEISLCPVCYLGKVMKTRWINCAGCHGTGRRKVTKGINRGDIVSCWVCGGRGQVEEVYEEICPNCHGEYERNRGNCRTCGGIGKVKCPRCGGTGQAKCQDCSGSGKVTCDRCSGVGETKCPDCAKRERDAKEKREREEREAKERRERKEREERNRRIAAQEKKEAAEKAAKERKDAIQGCGCLLALVAIVGFFIWWWLEGMTMSALSGMWEQTKNCISGAGLNLATICKIGGAFIAVLILWKLLKSIKGKSGVAGTSNKKRWKFVVLGILFGFVGVHLAYAKRWFLFLLLWAGLITGNVLYGSKTDSEDASAESTAQQVQPESVSDKGTSNLIGQIGFGVWALLWIGGTLFIKKDGKGNRM